MISVIICSINPRLREQVQANIDATIGVPWEAVIIDNRISNKSIAHVYNEGASVARNNILCFVHEDVLFRTADWGKKIIGYFSNDRELGLIGVAGSKYKSKTLSGWSTGLKEFDCCNILHLDKHKKETIIYSNPCNDAALTEVKVLDGVFLCATRTTWMTCRFNDALLDGFHFYDVDFSFRASAKFKTMVCFEINIIHLTQGGDFGDKWLQYAFLWHHTYQQLLPRHVASVVSLPIGRIELRIRKNWLHRLKIEKIALSNKLKWLVKSRAYSNIFAWPYFALFVLFRPYQYIKNVLFPGTRQ